MHFEREAREITKLYIDRDQLNKLFYERLDLANESVRVGVDNSFKIQLINNQIKTLLCLR